VFDIDDIRTGEHTLALVRSLQFSESNALQPISIARIVSVRCALNSEWSQKKKADRAAQLWPGYVQFLVYIIQKPTCLPFQLQNEEEGRK
jgi:hypothetical protein